jgi:hypothetical protein
LARRSAFQREQRHPRGFVLMERDRKAVEDVGRFRFLTARQLLQLNWPQQSQRRYGESRLRELFHSGWLDRQPFGVGLGHPLAVYSLGPEGRLFLSEQTGIPAGKLLPRPAKERNHDLLFLKHHLETVQTVINLAEAAEGYGGKLLYYREERLLRADFAKDRQSVRVLPDAFVVLAIGPRTQSFCIELDRATMDVAPWQRRIKDYLAWTRSEHFNKELQSPSVLVVIDATPRVAQRRVLELKRLVDDVAREIRADPSLFWFTALASAGPDSILSQPVWLVGGQEGLRSLYTEN